MFKRVMVAVIGIPALLLLIYLAPVEVLPVVVAILSAVAVYEALYSTGFLKHSRITIYSIIAATLVPFWSFYSGRLEIASLGLFVYVLLLFCEAMASHKKVGLEKMGGALFLTLIISVFLSALLRLRKQELWQFYILLPFVVAFTSDAFALFAGMAFGKHKLAPELSPKKTVEGAVGGLVGAVVCAIVYGLLAGPLFNMPLDSLSGVGVRLWVLAVYGALGSVLSQLGDLSFSYIKREYGIKDFGNIFPGHGGVLDRFDSVIFCAPFIELMLYILPVVK